jgi:hypothetical protein
MASAALPPHRPHRAALPQRVPQAWLSARRQGCKIRGSNKGCFRRMAAYFLPGHPVSTSASVEPLSPDMTDFPPEPPDTPVIRRSSIILVVAPEFGVEGLLLFLHRQVAVLLAPFGNCLQAPSQPLLHRSHVHCEFPFSTACTDVREAEEIQSAGFLPLPLRICLCIPPKFHQSRLLRMDRQTVFRESLRQDLHHPFCVLLVLEAQHGIIGEADLVLIFFAIPLVIGGYEHFVKSGPDNVSQMARGEFGLPFQVSAVVLVIFEILVCWASIRILRAPSPLVETRQVNLG